MENPLLLAEELYFLALHSLTGRTPLDSGLAVGLAGALVSELILEHRAALRHQSVVLVGRDYPDDELLKDTLDVLAAKRLAGKRLIAQISGVEAALCPLSDRVCARLASSGLLRMAPPKTLPRFRRCRYLVADTAGHEGLRERVRADLLIGHRGFSPRTACLVALLETCQLLSRVAVDHKEERRVLPCVQAAQHADPVAMAVRRIIFASQLASPH
ncbi:MAG: GOLPH3/VPS74 family protein [Solirubrobacteraceae bacterium]